MQWNWAEFKWFCFEWFFFLFPGSALLYLHIYCIGHPHSQLQAPLRQNEVLNECFMMWSLFVFVLFPCRWREKGLWFSVNCIIHADSFTACLRLSSQRSRDKVASIRKEKRDKGHWRVEDIKLTGSYNGYRCDPPLNTSLQPESLPLWICSELNLYYTLFYSFK